VPIRFGDYVAKIAVVPISPELTALTKALLNVNGVPNGIREAVVEFFRKAGGVWELRVQLYTNLDDMLVENAAIEWPESKSAYQKVAQIVVKPQSAWSEVAVIGNEDGAHHTTAEVCQALAELGFTIPCDAVTYWVGEAMGHRIYIDLDRVPLPVAKWTPVLASNAAHSAKLLMQSTYPGRRRSTEV
jgi:predicted CoA-binding protein